MKVCELCASRFEERETSCPKCRKLLGDFLARSLTKVEGSETIAMEVVVNLASRWGLSPFASGWRIVDILFRFGLAAALVWVTFNVWGNLEEQYHQAMNQLQTHDLQIQDALPHQRGMNPEETAQLVTNYGRLAISFADHIAAQRLNGIRQIAVILGLMAFLLTTAIGNYRSHRELNRLKATIGYLCSAEGQKFIARVMNE
jgi:hypothetical protein